MLLDALLYSLLTAKEPFVIKWVVEKPTGGFGSYLQSANVQTLADICLVVNIGFKTWFIFQPYKSIFVHENDTFLSPGISCMVPLR